MSITITVTDMTCEGCEEIVENTVSDLSGVESVEADREDGTVVVEGDVDTKSVMEAIDFAGYNPEGEADAEDDEE